MIAPVLGVGQGISISCVSHNLISSIRCPTDGDHLRATWNDGFAVAQKDLELRGPGEVLGTRQTGVMELRVADLLRDADLLPDVIEISEQLLATQPGCVEPLMRRWIRGGAQYAKV